MMYIIWVFYAFLAYLLGSICFSYYISRYLWKEDIREKGSNNAGASNMTINHGWFYGVLVFFLDFMKTFLVVKYISFFPFVKTLPQDQIFYLGLVCGLMSIIGHVFPIGMSFKGGKGTASAIGLAFALSAKLGLIGLSVIIIVTMASRYVALGAIALWVSLIVYVWLIFNDATMLGLILYF